MIRILISIHLYLHRILIRRWICLQRRIHHSTHVFSHGWSQYLNSDHGQQDTSIAGQKRGLEDDEDEASSAKKARI